IAAVARRSTSRATARRQGSSCGGAGIVAKPLRMASSRKSKKRGRAARAGSMLAKAQSRAPRPWYPEVLKGEAYGTESSKRRKSVNDDRVERKEKSRWRESKTPASDSFSSWLRDARCRELIGKAGSGPHQEPMRVSCFSFVSRVKGPSGVRDKPCSRRSVSDT